MRRVPALRLLQHPLHDPDLDRRRARRQDDPLRAADPRASEPMLWDFGSAVKHHQLYSQWVPDENYRAGFLGFRGAVAPTRGLMVDAVARDQGAARRRRRRRPPVGMDIVEPPFLFEMQRQGLTVVDAQQLMLDARLIKSQDEIMLLNQAAAMVDGVYQDIVEVLKPGVRENEIVALANKRLYEMGSDQVEADQRDLGRAVQPAPAQLHRPAHPPGRPGVLRHHPLVQRLPDLLLPHVRGRQRDRRRSGTPTSRPASGWTRRIDGIKPGVGTDQVAAVLPKAEEFGFENEMAAFGLQFAPRPRARPARAADHLAAQQHEGADRAPGRHGVRAGDLLPGQRRLLRGPDRGGGRGHRATARRSSPSFPAQDLVVTNPY